MKTPTSTTAPFNIMSGVCGGKLTEVGQIDWHLCSVIETMYSDALRDEGWRRWWTTDERSEMLPRRPCSGDSMGTQCGTCGRSKHMHNTLCRPSSTTYTELQSLLREVPEKVRDKRAKRPAGTRLGVDPDRFRYGSSSPFPLIEISACSPTVAKKH